MAPCQASARGPGQKVYQQEPPVSSSRTAPVVMQGVVRRGGRLAGRTSPAYTCQWTPPLRLPCSSVERLQGCGTPRRISLSCRAFGGFARAAASSCVRDCRRTPAWRRLGGGALGSLRSCRVGVLQGGPARRERPPTQRCCPRRRHAVAVQVAACQQGRDTRHRGARFCRRIRRTPRAFCFVSYCQRVPGGLLIKGLLASPMPLFQSM